MSEQAVITYRKMDKAFTGQPEDLFARRLAKLLCGGLIHYFICSKKSSWIALIDYVAALMPEVSIRQDIVNEAGGTMYRLGRKCARFFIFDCLAPEGQDKPKCLLISIYFDLANRSPYDKENMDCIRDSIEKLEQPFFYAEAKTAYAEDGNTELGFKISDTIDTYILTANPIPFGEHTYPEINIDATRRSPHP